MLPITQLLIGTVIVFILLLYSHYKYQKVRKSWLYILDNLHDLVSETGIIEWEAPVCYSSASYFKKFWKDAAFEGTGLLCKLETAIVFVGYLRNVSDPTIYTFIKYIFVPEDTNLSWIGLRFWVNGGCSWFTLSTQDRRHYFSAYLGKRLIFGSKAASKKIYDRLARFLKSP